MATTARKPKVRRIDSSEKFKRLSHQDLLAHYISARKARVITAIAIVLFLAWLLVFLLQPAPNYRLSDGRGIAIGAPEFERMLEALADGHFDRNSSVEVLSNGENYYPAELEAIRNARQSVNLEAYIFKKGKIAQQFVDALAERARAGVKVNVLIDGVGSFSTSKGYFQKLLDAGGEVQFYHPIRWNTWLRYNNRTHRELLVIDGEVAFAGGAGIADHWLEGEKDHPRWRDTMFRFRGDAVNSLQGTFVENWVESCGVVLNSARFFPGVEREGKVPVLVVNSTPSQSNATRARVLYQALLGSAQRRIYITTPYFLPDKALMEVLITAKRDRHLDVKVLVPGKKSDHMMTRSSSRGLYGKLLEAGVEIYEYQPSMLHAKVMLVDDDWVVVGSTNFDNRSFGINDELSVTARSAELAERLTADFARDLAQSERVTLESWKHRPFWQRGFEWAGWLISRHE
ncbi:MAG TPA: phospholipase D-like domain-containing protein [Terriglobales bacterium]|nr:phospholipase D-like domain-containing protein [Terriglobales bacterium]